MFACSKVKACGFLYDYRKPKNGHCVTYIYRNSVIKGEQWEDLAREDQWASWTQHQRSKRELEGKKDAW